MTFQLYDTLRSSLVTPEWRSPGAATIYLCGPTVYNFIHVGNARPAVVFDVLARHLKASGMKVTFVRNFTDIDDKIIKAATELGEEPRALAQRYIDAYLADTAALNCHRPDHEPRVSEHLPEIIEMVQTLIDKKHAYVRDGDVYFAVRTDPDYGKLSKRDLTELRAGERVAVDDRKDDPLDFALWKTSKAHEPAGARWPSPWGEGRPGWHIECSAMSRKILGDDFDIHGGGLDLIFPHHENEIAQSECATGHRFARNWMHNGFININDAKMSKSTMDQMGWRKTYFMLRNVLEHVDAEGVRLWLLGTQYRSPLNFEIAADDEDSPTPKVRFPGLEEAERRVEYFYETRARLAAKFGGKAPPAGNKPVTPAIQGMREKFRAAMDDDLNTAGALAPVADLFKRANELCDGGKKDAPEAQAVLDAIEYFTSVLGIAEGDPEAFFARIRTRRVKAKGIEPSEIDGLVTARNDARKAKDFARADEIRKDLLARGIEVRDAPGGGSTWRVV
jgi:cysteinyl-tRNA synthetase